MRLRLDPVDEYCHELGPEPNFNESMYFNVYDPTARLGAFFRLGNRANEGTGEMTVCVYLPDGRVGFMFKRPEVHDNDAFDSAGMRFEVVEPFEHLRVGYSGKLVMLDDPLAMADPRAAFTENPYVSCDVGPRLPPGERHVRRRARRRPRSVRARSSPRATTSSSVQATGTITVDGTTWPVPGLRPARPLLGPALLAGALVLPLADRQLRHRLRLHAVAHRPARQRRHPWRVRVGRRAHAPVPRRRGVHHAGPATTATTQRSKAVLRARGDGDDPREWRVTGRVLNLIPLRNRRDGLVTRISEGLTEWTLDDGRVGYGLSEYLDQIVDGEPVGLDE